MADAAELVIRIRDEGEHDRGSPNPPPSPPPPAPADVRPVGPAPASPQRTNPAGPAPADVAQQIASYPGARKLGLDARTLAGMHPDAVADIARQLGIGPAPADAARTNPAGPTAPPPPAGGGAPTPGGAGRGPLPVEVTNWPAGGTSPGPAGGFTRHSDGFEYTIPTGPPEPDTYRFADPKDRLEAGPTYGVQPPEDRPPRPPRAEPVGPKAEPVSPPPGEANAAFIKRNIPKGVGSALEGVGVDVAGAADAVGGATAAVGLGEIAAVAGPVAAALIVVDVAARAEAAALNAATKGVQVLGSMAADVAGNNYLGAFGTAADAAADGLEKIPIVGRVYAAELRLATAGVREYTKVVDAFVTRGRELRLYDAQISGAAAIADLRSTLADVKEANRLGPDMARLINAQSRVETAGRDAFLPVKELGTRLLAAVEERVATILERIVPLVEKLAQVAEFWYDHGPRQAVEVYEAVEQGFKQVYDGVAELIGLEKAKEVKDDLNQLMKDVFALGDAVPDTPAFPDHTAGAKDTTALPPVLGEPPR